MSLYSIEENILEMMSNTKLEIDVTAINEKARNKVARRNTYDDITGSNE